MMMRDLMFLCSRSLDLVCVVSYSQTIDHKRKVWFDLMLILAKYRLLGQGGSD